METLFGWLSRPDPGEARLSVLLAQREEARLERDNAFNGMKSARFAIPTEKGGTLDDLREEMSEADRAMREAIGGSR